MSYKYITTVLFLSTLLMACDDNDTVSSDIVTTSRIHTNFHVTADNGPTVFVDGELLPDGPSSERRIVLSKSDELWISNAGKPNLSYDGDDVFVSLKSISETSRKLSAGIDYSFNFLLFKFSKNISGAWHTAEIAANADDTYHLSFLRHNYNDASNNVVSLPNKFDLYAPLPSESLSRSNDLVVNWQAGSSDSVSINIVSSCFHDNFDEQEFNDLDDSTGSHTILASQFSPNASGQCNTTIEVVKSRLGQLDLNFSNGIISGHRVAKVSITTTD